MPAKDDFGGLPQTSTPSQQPIRQHPVSDGPSHTSSQPITTTPQPIRNPAPGSSGGTTPNATIANHNITRPPKQGDGSSKGAKPGAGITGASTTTPASTPAASVLTVHHGNGGKSGTKPTSGVAQGGVFQAGSKSGNHIEFGGPTAVAVGPNGSAGLSDIQKVRKYTFQIEKTEGKIARLNEQESQIRQQMAAADPSQQDQYMIQLAGIDQQKQKANERLENKQGKLDKVENRMASAGVSVEGQGVHAVAVAGIGKNGNGGKNNGGKSGGGVVQANNIGSNNNALAGVGGPDGGRPVGASGANAFNGNGGKPGGVQTAGIPQAGGNGNKGNGGGNVVAHASGAAVVHAGTNIGASNTLAGGADGGRPTTVNQPQAVGLGGPTVTSFMNDGSNNNANQVSGVFQVAGNGNGGGKKDNDGPKAMGGPVGGGNGGNGGNGNGNNNALAGSGIAKGDGNGNGGKKDNDGPKAMGGPVGGGNNDSLPNGGIKTVGIAAAGGKLGGKKK